MKKILIICFSVLIILTTIVVYYLKPNKTETTENQEIIQTTTTRKKAIMLEEVPVEQIQLANPASQYCEENGGKLEIRKDINKGEYGVCVFEDNKQCEEWAMFRNMCPIGGIKVAGYENAGQIECAIKGGEVDMEKDICIFKNKTCEITQNYLKCN